jgi:hypothetical protein
VGLGMAIEYFTKYPHTRKQPDFSLKSA